MPPRGILFSYLSSLRKTHYTTPKTIGEVNSVVNGEANVEANGEANVEANGEANVEAMST
jgi:hypothetical protein